MSRISNFEIKIEADVIPAAAIPYSVNLLEWNDNFSQIRKYQLLILRFIAKGLPFPT